MSRIASKNKVYASIALLVLALSASSCRHPYTEEYSAGNGGVRLFFNGTGSRTATAGYDTLGLSDFAVYSLVFTREYDNKVTTLYRNNTNREEEIELEGGTYTLVVTAYLESGAYTDENTEPSGLAKAAASCTKTVNVIRNTTQTVGITLVPYDPAETDGSENGTLEWVITHDKIQGRHPGNAVMYITPFGENTPVRTITLTPSTGYDAGRWISGGDGETFSEGFYYLDLEMTIVVGSDNSQNTLFSRHVIHIYRFLTTTFEYEFNCCDENNDRTLDNAVADQGGLGDGWNTGYLFVFDNDALDKINGAPSGSVLEVHFDQDAANYNGRIGYFRGDGWYVASVESWMEINDGSRTVKFDIDYLKQILGDPNQGYKIVDAFYILSFAWEAGVMDDVYIVYP